MKAHFDVTLTNTLWHACGCPHHSVMLFAAPSPHTEDGSAFEMVPKLRHGIDKYTMFVWQSFDSNDDVRHYGPNGQEGSFCTHADHTCDGGECAPQLHTVPSCKCPLAWLLHVRQHYAYAPPCSLRVTPSACCRRAGRFTASCVKLEAHSLVAVHTAGGVCAGSSNVGAPYSLCHSTTATTCCKTAVK